MKSDNYDRLIKALRAKAADILPKGSRLALYGSRARGDARPDSDWDIHVLVPDNASSTSNDYIKFAWPFDYLGLMEFGEIINSRVYTVNGWLKRSFLPFYKNVEQDKIIIYQN